MFCHNCGTEIGDNEKFCYECGACQTEEIEIVPEALAADVFDADKQPQKEPPIYESAEQEAIEYAEPQTLTQEEKQPPKRVVFGALETAAIVVTALFVSGFAISFAVLISLL